MSPSEADLTTALNGVFYQAGIHWTCAGSKNEDAEYEGLGGCAVDGKLDRIEFATLTQIKGWHPTGGWGKGFKAIIFKELEQNTPATNHANEVFSPAAYTAPNYSTPQLVIAHEFGHLLGLATKPDPEGGRHDTPPWPPGEESLMRRGPGTTGVMAIPGKWLRHEDWRKANMEANRMKDK